MTLRNLPEIKALKQPAGFRWDVPSDALARWSELPVASDGGLNTIEVYDVIGECDWSGEGCTAKRVASALASADPGPITVKINSPGGSVFEGFAIYNELRKHPERIHVEIMGIAASAAAYIAMSGDKITMSRASFMMVHNSWGMVIGNRHDLSASIGILEKIDGAQIEIFSARTGLNRREIERLLDAETYLSASEAVAFGFADAIVDGLTSDKTKARAHPEINARRRLDSLLAQCGVPRSERRSLIRDASIGQAQQRSVCEQRGSDDLSTLQALLETLRPKSSGRGID
ncbi:head maturation protease, ClpP-related [Defluviimonas salinarum]|uniref:ATP-dependent Clp protease proteolytic subunit n=1 Tax=Defluviimonas salinarum TaxID=2992147 RepID=A0ABT3IXY1_9RHOB|nr:head maturation protease, ClpP-related [Defluviimonas salinarum]MCW3780273.1 Clp protease ClpP [Defluviimonas salinarum]